MMKAIGVRPTYQDRRTGPAPPNPVKRPLYLFLQEGTGIRSAGEGKGQGNLPKCCE